MQLVDSAGRPVGIEAELYRGGEGTIHPVAGRADVLAKLYHARIDTWKQEKLGAMTRAANDALMRVAAWPAATLHERAGGRMAGFLMPRFDGQRFELHHLYRPDSRKQTFRRADWAFLHHAARNVAAAVATVHAAGHVVGDVNQRNFIVGADATVKVLDCDSFQIRAAGRVFRCLVGVPEFTPPELQNLSLDGVDRTPDHDAFGLAVLVFQLLFMGRHPFAGRFHGTGDMPIERAIAEGRFAFGRMSRQRLMEPPPNLVAFDSLSPRLSALFESAFANAGSRPTPRQWSDALDVAQKELRACAMEPMHRYHRMLAQCPWCALERASGIYFFIGIATTRATTFDLNKIWAEIVTLAALPYEAPTRPAFDAEGDDVPLALSLRRRMAIVAKGMAIGLAGGFLLVRPEGILFVAMLIVLIWLVPLPGRAEQRRRLARFQQAEQAWLAAYRSAEGALSVDPLLRKRLELQKVKASYESVDDEKQNELAKLTANAREIQLRHFLERHLILTHDIPDIGPKRKATLLAWNIDTAADVTWDALGAVQGFGPTLQARMMAWRASIESRFVFDPKRAVPQQDVDAVVYRSRRRKAELEQQLRAGADELRRMHHAIRQRRLDVAKELEEPARLWAQTRADLHVIERITRPRRGGTT